MDVPSMDFETYSGAGYVWDEERQRWRGVTSNQRGIKAVGAAVYSEHPTTEVLCVAYDLKDGKGPRVWYPRGACPEGPHDLLAYIAIGGHIQAWNSSFEYYIWTNVCHKRMGWPPISLSQLRCSMSKSYAHALPGKLLKAAEIIGAGEQKDKYGETLLRRLSIPRNPTIKNASLRLTPETASEDFNSLYEYCVQDVKAEGAVSALTPDLSPFELEVWLLDQKINTRGVHIDSRALYDCISVIESAFDRYTQELKHITNGEVQSANEIKKITAFLAKQGLAMPSIAKACVSEALARTDIPPVCRRVLEIRALLSAASVKKLYSIKHHLCADNRLRDLFAYCGADRTGRWAGRGPQPHNLPNSGPLDRWNVESVDTALSVIASRDVDLVEMFYGSSVGAVSGCLRGLFRAAPGKELICSDYSSIEAVVIAELAGETWRQEVFRTHRKLYEMSASNITGIPFDTILGHKEKTGDHHPMRKLGKVAELSGAYQGGLGAWKACGADKFMTDEEIQEKIKVWREASPRIVAFWYGLQDAAMNAVRHQGRCFYYNGIGYGVKGNVLYCKLLSGRTLTYHQPRIEPQLKPWGKVVDSITYMGWNSDSLKGPIGWTKTSTYGGKLAENCVQATARDILAHAMLYLDHKYPIVLHVHDEVVSEVDEGYGSVEEYESIMGTMPDWCKDWPVIAAGGWRGQRYRKD